MPRPTFVTKPSRRLLLYKKGENSYKPEHLLPVCPQRARWGNAYNRSHLMTRMPVPLVWITFTMNISTACIMTAQSGKTWFALVTPARRVATAQTRLRIFSLSATFWATANVAFIANGGGCLGVASTPAWVAACLLDHEETYWMESYTCAESPPLR